MSPRPLRAFIVAGEASGDALGGDLLAALKDREPDMEVQGIAGPRMQAAGMQSLFPMQELSVMGLAEILPRYFELRRRMVETAQAAVAARPDVLITIDLPDFCLPVARRVRKAVPEVRTVHYVSPSVWAWRPQRAAKMAGIVDQVLALLPFEPPLLQTHGIRCDFVGHPLANAPQANAAEIAALRLELGVAASQPLLLVLPGSRRSEVARLAPVFGQALGAFAAAHPGTKAVLPVAPGMVDTLGPLIADWPLPVVLVGPGEVARKRAAFAAADLALAASGTVSLELAAAGTPMVIGYRMNPLTMAILRRLALVDTVTLVNLVSDTRTVPELLGGDCTPDALARALAQVHTDPAPQEAAMRTTMDRLGRGGPGAGDRAAMAVLDGLGRPGG